MDNPLGELNPFPPKEKKYVYVKRNDNKFRGSTVDMTVEEAQAAIKRNPEWVILGDALEINEQSYAPKLQTLSCPLCPYQAKSNQGLLMHKRKHQ